MYALTPGQQMQDSVTVRNLTADTKTFRLYPSDASNAAGDAAFALRSEDAPKIDVATWLRLSSTVVTIPGNGQIDVPFAVSVPANVTPGDHSGGLVAVDTTPSSQITGQGAQITVVHALAVRIYARVAGPLHAALDINGLQLRRSEPLFPHLGGLRRATLSFDVVNAGNVRESPSLRIRITDQFGHIVIRLADRQLPDLLPGGSVPVTTTWNGGPAAARLTARIELFTGQVDIVRKVRVWSIPWAEALAVLALASAAIGLAGWSLSRRAHGPKRARRAEPVQPP